MKKIKKNILIVDDLTDNVKLLSGKLEGLGYYVSVAKNYAESLIGLKSKSPELILVGSTMSGSDSFKAIREFKEINGSESTPIMMYSSCENSSEKIDAFNSGVVDYFSKPFSKADILARLKTHLTIDDNPKKHLWSQRVLDSCNDTSRVGGWEFNVKSSELYWSLITKKIHEVENDFKPKLEDTIVFFREGQSREVAIRCIEKSLERGDNWDIEVQVVTSKGNLIWVRSIGEPVFENGKVVRIFGTFQEISDEKDYKIELEKSETSIREVLKIAKAGSWEIELATGEMQWSDELFFLLEINKSEKPTRELLISMVHPDDHKLVNYFATKRISENRNEQDGFRIITTSGTIKYVRVDSRIVKDYNKKVTNVVGTLIDISDQKEANDKLKGLQKHFQLSFETASIAICRLTKDGRINLVNERAIQLFGYTRVELMQKSFTDISHPDDVNKSIAFFNNVMQRNDNQLKIANRYIHKNGTVIWAQVSSAFVQGDEDEEPNLFAYILDVTDLKKAEITLNRYKNIISESDDILAIADRNSNYLIANDAFCRAMNLTREEIIGRNVAELIGVEYFDAQVKERVDRCLKGEQVSFDQWIEFPILGWRFIEMKYSPNRNSQNEIEGYLIDGRDITEKKKSQDRLKSLTRIQQTIIEYSSIEKSSHKILEELLNLTNSEFGFIGEVSYENDKPYIDTHALMNLSLDEEVSSYFEENIQEGIDFLNMSGLFDKIIGNGKSIITNKNASNNGIEGTNKMNNSISLPFFHNNVLVGIVGMANREGGYREEDTELLNPFLATCSTLIDSFKKSKIRKKAEKERKKLADIVSYSNDAIISTDLNLRVISWNSGAEILLGYTAEEMIGKSADILRPKFLDQKHDSEVRSAQQGVHVPGYETVQLKKDGEEIHVNMSLFPLIGDNGEVSGVSSILRDITAQKEAVEMKARFTRNLEIKVSDRTAELQRAKAELALSLENEKELGELKSRFVATASHQFRTPLTVIQSNMGILAMQKDAMNEQIKPSFDKAYGRIKKEISRMTSLMDDVLILGKINSGGIVAKSQPIDMIELCEDVSNNYNEIQEDGRMIKFEQSGIARLITLDSKQMEHVISNLLSNALKYSPAEESPILLLSYHKSKVLISVKDKGMGIPEQDLKHLFEPFYRASNVGEISGTGLGSTIAKEYVELNGGTISVKSEMNVGSEFIIEFKNK